MAITELRVEGYRSIRDLRVRLRSVNVLTGPNGCGKSNLYNSMFLLARAASGGFARAIAQEGGMPSVVWAGPPSKAAPKRAPVRVNLAVAVEPFDYELQFGLVKAGSPVIEGTAFRLDPDIKEEAVRLQEGRCALLMEREGPVVSIRDGDGRMARHGTPVVPSESVLSQLQEPQAYPELYALRQEMAGWRFYHQFRTDAESPIRYPQVGVRTPVLAHDGRDLAAALQTIIEIGDELEMRDAIHRAFPGGSVEIEVDAARALFSVALRMPGIQRAFAGSELSDGTLRYLCLVAALLSPRPPSLMALNEPETSLHPDLIPALANLIATAARSSQLWITTHSRALAAAIEEQTGEASIELEMVGGETRVKGRGHILPA